MSCNLARLYARMPGRRRIGPMADPNDLLARADAEEAAEVAALEQRASPFSALYAHWERNQWSALALDLETDRQQLRGARPERAGGHGLDLRASLPRRVQRRAAARAVPARGAELRRPAAAGDAGRRTSTATCRPSCASTRRSSACAVASTPCARSPTATWISSPRRCTRGSSTTSGKLSATSERGRVPRRGGRLPPARRGRDRPHRAEPRRQPVRAALVPGARRGPAPGRARRGAAHRHRRLVRAPAHGAGARADERGDHARDRGAARALVGAARPGRRRARRPRAQRLRHRSDRLLPGGPAARPVRLASVGYDATSATDSARACASASSPTTTTPSSGASPSTSTGRPSTSPRAATR